MKRTILAVATAMAVAGCAGSDPGLPDCGVADVDGRYIFNCPAFSVSGAECRPLEPGELPSVNGERGFYVERMTFFCPL